MQLCLTGRPRAQAVTFVRKRLADGQSPRHVCEELCDQCLAPNTAGDGKGCDNMSAMVVLLKSFAAPAKGTHFFSLSL